MTQLAISCKCGIEQTATIGQGIITIRVANNRLISTQVGSNIYSYPHHPQHGFITAMPHLEEMGWNFKEELVKTIRQRRTDGGTPETTYYQYDGQGQRIRKITENQADAGDIPSKKDERIYISGYELYKQHSGADAGLERISLSLMDKEHRFVMIDMETKPKEEFGIPVWEKHSLNIGSLSVAQSSRLGCVGVG